MIMASKLFPFSVETYDESQFSKCFVHWTFGYGYDPQSLFQLVMRSQHHCGWGRHDGGPERRGWYEKIFEKH